MSVLKQKAYVVFIIFIFLLGFHCLSLFLDLKCKHENVRKDGINEMPTMWNHKNVNGYKRFNYPLKELNKTQMHA